MNAPPCSYGKTDCVCGFMGTWNCGTCPSKMPSSGDSCTTDDLPCTYPGGTCTCHYGGGGTLSWDCPPPPCPKKQPKAGDNCTFGTGGFAGCTYGANVCNCVMTSGGDEWSCT